ncbi:MAG: DEAD/DEAH box helicase family protein [Ilumatobacteraceae bacterium]
MSTVTLRPWQRDAFDAFLASSSPDFLAVATPGAGKTTFALTCARALLAHEPRPLVPPPVVVVAPTSHLKIQWSLAAHRMGLQLDPDWSPSTGLARDVHGLVTTYQQLAIGDTAAKIRGLVADGIVILDEIHHAGHERAWGDGVARAFELAARRLSLSGTPFRSDTAQIPFVRYDVTGEGDLAHADFTYGYAEALRDGGVVRPVYFPRFDGQMEWSTPAGDIVRASFSDALARDQASLRLRTALSLDGEWLPTVLDQADERLREIRSDPDDGQPDAGGLVIATDQDHAHGIARILRDRLRTPVDVVVSDDPSASRKIAEFARNDRPWLVAVRMVSEGVDIPRLRVGVYATTTTTELFFRQAVGRFVRWQAGRPSQKAYVYLPDDPRLRAHAFAIAEARRHVLRPPSSDDGDDGDSDPLDGAALDAQVHPDDLLPEQLSLFSVLSSTATGLSIHGITESGIEHVADTWTITPAARFDDEPDVPEPSFTDDPELAVDLPSVPTPAGSVPTGSLSLAERKDDLRTRNADLAKRLVDLTGWSHARVQAEMNRLAGITKVSTATSDQLERRLRYSESWHRRLRGR